MFRLLVLLTVLAFAGCRACEIQVRHPKTGVSVVLKLEP